MNLRSTLLTSLAAFALSPLPPPAVAAPVTIGFEGVVEDGTFVTDRLPYSEAGFTLTVPMALPNSSGIYGKDVLNANGSAIFVFCTTDSNCGEGTTVHLTGSAPFSLLSLDVGIPSAGFGEGSIDVIGTRAGGGSITTTLGAGNVWQSYVLSGFENLSSVQFIGRTAYSVAFDKLVVNPSNVPEPSSLALALLALAGAAGIGRVSRRS